MSDNDSIDSNTPRRSSRIVPQINPGRSQRFATESPLRGHTLGDFSALMQSLTTTIQGLSTAGRAGRHAVSLPTNTSNLPLSSRTGGLGLSRAGIDILDLPLNPSLPQYMADPRLIGDPRIISAPRESKTPLKSITTVVSLLPEITYKEQDDVNGSERTLAYVKVQRMLLKYLETNASDTLTPQKVRAWTERIEPITKKPKAADALRLCYYMRSQGFDTYSVVKNGRIDLYVANQDSDIRDAWHDQVYWRQNFTTNFIEYTAPSNARVAPRAGRRNALAAMQPVALPREIAALFRAQEDLLEPAAASDNPSFQPLGDPIFPPFYNPQTGAGLSGPAVAPEVATGEAIEQPVNDVLSQALDQAAREAIPSPEAGQLPTTPQAERLMSLVQQMTSAETQLNNLLLGADQDPTAIEAILLQIEQLRTRLHRD